MTIRTNPAEVQAIIPDTINILTIDTFVNTASLLIDTVLGSSSLSDEILERIECFLTAHLLYSTIVRQTQNKSVGDASETYAKLGEGLKSTTYGQIVAQLDTTGALINTGKSACIIEAIPSFDDSLVG